MEVTAVFDIGKTNKKLFLFNRNYQEVYHSYNQFPEIRDEDGDPCDDLSAIQQWIRETFAKVLRKKKFSVKALNFSTYGASFVHIDHRGQAITPIYNYLKPFPPDLLQEFHAKYGDEITFAKETASPPLGMLNSGLQLYWLKYCRPEIFKKIRWSLHFPQYLSHLFTDIPVSEYTSIGCHTGLWDFSKNDYHSWVYAEQIDKKLAPIVPTSTSINCPVEGKRIKVGVGIHDSSAALLPYLKADPKPFVLISTGTWSISINPFSHRKLSSRDLQNDCLNFLKTDGGTTTASRLFLGNEYKIQTRFLCKAFDKPPKYHRRIRFDRSVIKSLKANFKKRFHFKSIQIKRDQPDLTDLGGLVDFEQAYHQLMMELVDMQIAASDRVISDQSLRRIYVDGGFANNDIYMNLLRDYYKEFKICSTKYPLGSALGACMVVSDKKVKKAFLKKNYDLRKY